MKVNRLYNLILYCILLQTSVIMTLNAQFVENTLLTDQCVCNNDQSANGAEDGTFSETIVITGPCGLNIFTGSGSQPPGLASLPFNSSTPDPMTGLCDYTLNFNHVDGIGYDFCVVDMMGNAITGSGTGLPVCYSNVCVYPEITEPTFGPLCINEPAINNLDGLVSEVDNYPGNIIVTINGSGSNDFDPALLGPGTHSVLWTFTGSGTGDSGGTVANPAFPGCETSYSLDVDVYDSPILTVSSCMCGFDPNTNSVGSLVNFTITGGTGPYNVTSNTGILSNSSPPAGSTQTLYLGVDGAAFTLSVADSNGCFTSFSDFCSDCYFDIAIDDPCTCNNDQSYNGSENGTFGEQIEINGPSGLNLIVGAGSTGLIGAPVGTPIPEVLPGVYELAFDHQDLIGYTVLVEADFGGNTGPVLDNLGNQLTITNRCQYPVISEPQLNDTDFCFNADPLVFTGNEVSEINGFTGFVQVYLGGITTGTLITEFDPTQYPKGIYELTFLFTGDFVDNIYNGVDPAFPGCMTMTSIQIGVGGGGAIACNDNVNVTVDHNCEAEFAWESLLEADYVPNIFEAEFTDSAGNIVNENDLGSYAGSSLNYSIIDQCNGNYCWGTINIDDKSIPTIECDCPVGGEDPDGDGVFEYSEDCTLSCYEIPLFKEQYWDRLRDDLIPSDVGDFLDDYVGSACDDVLEEDISFYDYIEDLECGGALLRRTWVVNYDKGNGVAGDVTCTNEYYFKPLDIITIDTAEMDLFNGGFVKTKDRVILPVELVVMDCGVDISPASIAAYFDDPSTQDNDTDDDNIDPDELDIDCVVENNESIPYAYPHYYMNGRNPSGPHAQAIDNEVCNILVAYTDNEVEACAPGCGGNIKVLRNWTILDWCAGEFIRYGQVIKAVDKAGPTIQVRDVFASVEPENCFADVSLPHPEHLYDDCTGDVSYWIGYVDGALTVTGNQDDGFVLHETQEGVIYRVEYIAEDCCGNQTNTFINVQVVDLTPPVPVTKEFIVVSLSNIGNPIDGNQGVAKIYAEDFDNGSYDGCSGIEVAVRRLEKVCEDQDTFWGDYVKFCCEDLNGQTFVEIDVHFRVTDENGNVNYAWSTVRLEDKSTTTQTCPPDLVLTCEMDYNNFTLTGLPQLFAACGEIALDCDIDELIEDTEPRRKGPNDGFFNDPRYDGVEIPAFNPTCGYGAIRRQFKSCSSCTQWFVIEPIDPFNPISIVFPADIIVDCDAADIGEPDWENAVCTLIGVSVESDTFYLEDGACMTILNHWSIINWCEYDPTQPTTGGRWNHTQIVKIIDTQDPIITAADSLCFAVNEYCVSGGGAITARANDEGDCGSKWIKWELTIDLNADWTSDYFYSTSVPEYVNGELNPYYIAPTGNDELASAFIPEGVASSKIWHRAVWRAYDGCGNNSNLIRYFQITDKKAPTPYCLNLSTTVMSSNGEVELWAIDFNVGSFDNCSTEDNIIYTFTDVAPPTRDDTEYDSSSDLQWYNGTFWYFDLETGGYQDQDDYFDLDAHRWEPGLRSTAKIFTIEDTNSSGYVNIPIYAWDECGNSDFCIVNMRLIDNDGVGEGIIAGTLETEYGDYVEHVETELSSDLPDYPKIKQTDDNGFYLFDDNPMNSDYLIRSNRSDDYLNGVSTLDLLLIQKHILGQTILDSPYKMIAADINNDFEITAIDLIELRKLILGVHSALPNNYSWNAIDADQDLNTDNVWTYKDYRVIYNMEANKMEEDFIAVKIGDVNGNADVNSRMGTPSQNSDNALEISFIDKYAKEGDLVELELLHNITEGLYGYQFTMSIPGYEFVDIQGDNIDHNNVAIHKNKITISHYSEKMISEGMCKIILKSNQEGYLSDQIEINSDITHAEAYTGPSYNIVNVLLQQEEPAYTFKLYQNIPNPFKEYTEIGFELDKAEEIALIFYDYTGRLIKTIGIDATKGYNSMIVNREELNTSGLIYYKIETSAKTEIKHMIMIE